MPKRKFFYTQKRHNAIAFLIEYISYIQYIAFIEYEILLRGGIAKGNLFVNDDFIIGTSLVEAYLLESEKAVYPRVIISEDIMKEYFAKEYISDNMGCLIMKSPDGFYIPNYLINSRVIGMSSLLVENLKKHKTILCKSYLKQNVEKLKIRFTL